LFAKAKDDNEEEKMLKMAIAESIKSAEEHTRNKDSAWYVKLFIIFKYKFYHHIKNMH